MKHLFGTMLLGCAVLNTNAQATLQGIYQFADPSFEKYTSGEEPGNGWNSFSSALTKDFLTNLGKKNSPRPSSVTPGANNSQRAVKIFSAKVLGVANANGNITTGIINMGSSNATDPSNHNFTKTDDPAHSLKFAGRPDSVSFYAKFKAGTGNTDKVARANFILHDECQYRDPEIEDQKANRIGKASQLISESSDWTRYATAFSYDKVATDVQYLLASVTTNPIAGGSADDELFFDEVYFIYNSSLSDLQYNEKTLADFSKDKYEYTVYGAYTDNCLAITKDCVGGSSAITFDAENQTATITVKGDDWSVNNSNQHEYKVKFLPLVMDYTNDLTITMGGSTTVPQSATVQIIQEVNNTYSFQLNNFFLGDKNNGGQGIGNIKLTEVDVNNGIYTKEQSITITAGDDAAANGFWIGPMLGEITVKLEARVTDNRLTARIYIPFGGETIQVIIAATIDLSENEVPTLSSTANFKFTRQFPIGWSTICLPFETSPSYFNFQSSDGWSQSEAKVQAFTSATEEGLNFTELKANDKMEANTPYLIYFPEEKMAPSYFATTIESVTPKEVSFGDWTFVGSYTGLAAGELTGKFGVVANENGGQSIRKAGPGATISGTRAYFEYRGTQSVNSMSLNLDGIATGIESVGNPALPSSQFPVDIYSMDGRLVKKNATHLNGLPKGIYIVNGKKIIVK